MLNIYDATTMICEIREHARKVGMSPLTLVMNTPQGRKLNEILEKADRLDEVDFPGNESPWYLDIHGNRHRLVVGSFGIWHVESQMAFQTLHDGKTVEWSEPRYSAPVRNQGAAISVLARKLMVHSAM